MDCDLCMEPFDVDARRPKVLPCGHSACLDCVLQLPKRECSICRKVFPATETLPDNYKLMDNVAEKSKTSLWCMECGTVATAVCEKKHSVKGMNKALQRQVGQVLQQLQKLSQHLKKMAKDCTERQVLESLNVLSPSKGSYEISLRRQDGNILKGSLDTSSTEELSILYDTIVKILAFILIKSGFLTHRSQDDHPPADVCSPPQTSARNPDNRLTSSGTGRPNAPDALFRQPAETILEFVDVGWITLHRPREKQQLKRNILERVQQQGVRRLVNVFCNEDSDWSESLLKAAAPRLETLELVWVRRQHLMTLQGMPRLRHLAVAVDTSVDPDLYNEPLCFPALPSSHCGLLRLKAWNLPRDTFLSLLKVHAGTLDEVQLLLGTPGNGVWPHSCNDLHEELGRCNLNQLVNLTLWRTGCSCSHTSGTCAKQLQDVKGSLPNGNVSVSCTWCYGNVPWLHERMG